MKQLVTQLQNVLWHRHMTMDELVEVLQVWVKEYHAKVTTTMTEKQEPGAITVHGMCDLHIEQDSCEIELGLITHPDTVSVLFDTKMTKSFVFEFVQVLQHELIHADQYEKRDWEESGIESCGYYDHPDEIDAHAHDIALELHHAHLPLTILKKSSTIKKEDSMTLWRYYQEFPWTHPVIRALLKKVVKYYKSNQ